MGFAFSARVDESLSIPSPVHFFKRMPNLSYLARARSRFRRAILDLGSCRTVTDGCTLRPVALGMSCNTVNKTDRIERVSSTATLQSDAHEVWHFLSAVAVGSRFRDFAGRLMRRLPPLPIVLLVLAACENRPPQGSPDTGPSSTALAVAASARAGAIDAAPSASLPSEEATRTGTAGLVIYQVEVETCEVAKNYDVAVETSDADAGKKPMFVFCRNGIPATTAGGFKVCKFHTRCEQVREGVGSNQARVRCDKKEVTLEVAGGRTVVRGPLGEWQVADHPMQIAPVRVEKRPRVMFGCYR